MSSGCARWRAPSAPGAKAPGRQTIAVRTEPPALASRRIALDLLKSVFVERRPFDDALATHDGMEDLSSRDRAFARLLVTTVLRRLGEIDARLDAHLHRPLPKSAAPVRMVLRLGVAQLVYLKTPPHAAVDTAVRLLDGRLRGFKGLVNAVLRKAANATAGSGSGGAVNTPEWLWRSWVEAYGAEQAAAIVAAHLGEPPIDISVAGNPETWRDRLGAERLPTGSLRRPVGGDPSQLPGFAEGAWWVQDAAAALPAILLGPVGGQTVIDLCAAPGGKTAQLAAAGARVTAVDRSAPRLRRLTANLERLRLSADIVTADATTWRPAAPADAVLLDAPCTATGTIRRHPDIAHLKTAKDVARLSELQDRLLRAAVAMVKPGGRLVYATCSLQPAEGPDRVAALIDSGAPVELDPVQPAELPDLAETILPDGTVRTLPCHWHARGGMDGFFIARLRRR